MNERKYMKSAGSHDHARHEERENDGEEHRPAASHVRQRPADQGRAHHRGQSDHRGDEQAQPQGIDPFGVLEEPLRTTLR